MRRMALVTLAASLGLIFMLGRAVAGIIGGGD